MELLNKYKIRLDDPNMNMGIYMFFEYTVYNWVSIEYRLKYLKNGVIIFERHGRSYHDFLAFHRSKANIFLWYVYVVYVAFGLFSILLFVAGLPAYACMIPILTAFCLKRLVLDRRTRSNHLHVNEFLANSNLLERLLQIPSNDTDKFKNLAKQFYWNDLNMQIQDRPELTIKTQEFSGAVDEGVKNDSFMNAPEIVKNNFTVDLDQPIRFKDIFLNETLYNKAIEKLSDYFTEDGSVVNRDVGKAQLVAILYFLRDQRYLFTKDLTAKDFQKIASKLLDEEVSIDVAKYTTRVTKPKYDVVKKLFS